MTLKPKDMNKEEFIKLGYQFVDWIADYLDNIEDYDVLPNIEPGDIKKEIPPNPPKGNDNFNNILKDVDEKIAKNLTHWNHPGFMAYFSSTSSGPGILAEFLSAAFNVNGMVWKSAPASVELEERMIEWLREFLNISNDFTGIIYDTASVSTMHAIAAARESINLEIRKKGMSGRNDLPLLKIYITDQTHSSIEKAALTLGLGLQSITKVKTNSNFSMNTAELEKEVKTDLAKGNIPLCVVATIGTTSSTAIDPVNEIAEFCNKNNIWLHVDSAYAGVISSIDEYKNIFEGWNKADSIVVNPHKWLFVPIDLSSLFIKKPEILKRAFSLIPEYLKTEVDEIAVNYMDYGIQLGRRFRSLKLWFIFRYYGTEGLREILKHHLQLAKKFEQWIDEHKYFEKMAEVNFGTICFRARINNVDDENKLELLNKKLMDEVNHTGKIFITHTKLNGKFVLRLVLSGIRTEEKHLELAENILDAQLNKLIKGQALDG
ncbi:MAG: aminotransferase class I/II-fold pyridoxal phosphate-dependent enzyme [Melioribacteraceae bacterium]|nr:aminotransferase class I/II-fold pyridoxal phosphate-dependent enzyme [Melioribacteraceae bacterium]